MVVTVAFASVSAAAETAVLKARFVYEGDAPKPKPTTPQGGFCGGFPLIDESLLVDPETNGIRNVILYVYTGPGGAVLPASEPPKKVHELTNQDCRFEPHVLLARAGDTLKITNQDMAGHNTNVNFFANPPANFVTAIGDSVQVAMPNPEPAPIPVECNIHPWMKAYIVVLDHPYAAVSDKDGTLTIEGLPAGRPISFRIVHEALRSALDEVRIKDQWWPLERNRLEIMIHPGINDLGDIVVPARAFR
ncbi:methylamine utilization protein [Candidatus Laterigemmans baculatus]|uniref:methylamine utilization protein n=1 Tax=Candidatus Laterigemmans baculatus TaxID=2770505 RepID=UPI001F3B731D|nr:methylamine utilization protein [Candidatus Laterigemmans baculatus]